MESVGPANTFCAQCGKLVGPGDAFCGRCGAAVFSTAQPLGRSSAPSAYDNYAPAHASRWIWPKRIAIVSALLAGAFFVIGALNGFIPAFKKSYAAALKTRQGYTAPTRMYSGFRPTAIRCVIVGPEIGGNHFSPPAGSYEADWNSDDPQCGQPDQRHEYVSGSGKGAAAAVADYKIELRKWRAQGCKPKAAIATQQPTPQVSPNVQPNSEDLSNTGCAQFPATVTDFAKRSSLDLQMSIKMILNPELANNEGLMGPPQYLEVFTSRMDTVYVSDSDIEQAAVWNAFGAKTGRGLGVLLLRMPTGERPENGPIALVGNRQTPLDGVGSWHSAIQFRTGEFLLLDAQHGCSVHFQTASEGGMRALNGGDSAMLRIPVDRESAKYRAIETYLQSYIAAMVKPATQMQQGQQSTSPVNSAPESQAEFVRETSMTLGDVFKITSDQAETIARHKYIRCHGLGYSTHAQMNDCILNHPDELLVTLPRGTGLF